PWPPVATTSAWGEGSAGISRAPGCPWRSRRASPISSFRSTGPHGRTSSPAGGRASTACACSGSPAAPSSTRCGTISLIAWRDRITGRAPASSSWSRPLRPDGRGPGPPPSAAVLDAEEIPAVPGGTGRRLRHLLRDEGAEAGPLRRRFEIELLRHAVAGGVVEGRHPDAGQLQPVDPRSAAPPPVHDE